MCVHIFGLVTLFNFMLVGFFVHISNVKRVANRLREHAKGLLSMEHWKTEYVSLDSLHMELAKFVFHAPMLVSLALQTMVDIAKVISEVSTIYSSKTILSVGVSANEIFAQSSALAALFSAFKFLP